MPTSLDIPSRCALCPRRCGADRAIVVKETRTIPGYIIDPGTQTQTVMVNPNDTQTLTFYNSPTQTLTIQKYVDGTTDPIQGVTFLVTDSSGAVLSALLSDESSVSDDPEEESPALLCREEPELEEPLPKLLPVLLLPEELLPDEVLPELPLPDASVTMVAFMLVLFPAV